jgi:general secretion pathway protein F/type IV pilus assembly protein PilC
MLLKYTAYNSLGKKEKGTIEASDLVNGKSKLKAKGLIVTNISEDNFAIIKKFLQGGTKSAIDPLTLAVFSRDLSIYLNSGISLVNAIKLIRERFKNDRKLASFFEAISSLLNEGKNFYTSLNTQESIKLPEFYLQSIKISENGGTLNQILVELADYLKKQYRLQKQISGAMAYPIFIILVSIGMVGFMLSFIVPKITDIFDQNKQELPGITEFVISLGDFVNAYYQIGLLIALGLFFGLTYIMKTNYAFKYKFDTFMLRLPFIGNLIELGELSRFAYMNSILIRSGVPVVQSFKLGANIVNNSVIKKLFEEASVKVVEGEKLSKILSQSKTYKVDIAFIQAVAIGEETSELSSILESLAQLYTEANKDKMDTFLTLLEPMFMLIVGGMIGFIVIAMLLPIFSMSIG